MHSTRGLGIEVSTTAWRGNLALELNLTMRSSPTNHKNPPDESRR
jgi:hypothetical protein